MTLGETLEQLDGLDRAATIVCWNGKHREDLRRRILDRLGAERASQITIVVVDSSSSAMAHLTGRRAPVYLDARWYGIADHFLIDMVEAYARICNAQPRPPRLERTTRFD